MKRCPLCQRSYRDAVEVCEIDGTVLKEAGARQDILIGRVLKGRYRVLQKLGEGGMGTVYLAEQVTIGRKVALKVLHEKYVWDEEFVKRFRQEARLTASLNHPHVITIHDFDQIEDGSLFIAMEYVEGRNLRELIEEGALGIPRAVGLGIQIAEGLEAAHRVGVIHRDVKPENIMVAKAADQVKLTDFGIARLRDAEASTRLTRPGTLMGTPAYMAPEQIEGGEVSEKTDIYAFGIVLYELLSGEPPFDAPTPGAILVKHLKDAPPPLRKFRGEIPPAVEHVVMQTLEKKPENRAENMAEIIGKLKKTLEPRARVRETRSEAFLEDIAERQEPARATVFETNEEWPSTPAISPPRTGRQTAKRSKGKWQFVTIGVSSVIFVILALIAVLTYLPKKDEEKPQEASVPPASILSLTLDANRTQLMPQEWAFLTLRARYSDGREESVAHGIEWESSDPTVAAVNVTGELQGLREGNAEIRARYEGLQAEPIRITVRGEEPKTIVKPVVLRSLTIHADKQELRAKERLPLMVKGLYSDGNTVKISQGIKWESSNEAIASVTQEGEVVANKKGEAQITARYAGVVSKPMIVSVLPEIAYFVSLRVRSEKRAILVGETARLKAEGKYSDGEVRDLSEKVVWRSSNPSVAEIGPGGMTIGHKAGKAMISAAYQETSHRLALVVKDKEPEPVPDGGEKGPTRRSWLGARIQRVTPEIAKSLGPWKDRGALVGGVEKDSPAEHAGIKVGDVIIEFDGKQIEDPRLFPRLVANTEVGTRVKLKVIRGGREIPLAVLIGERKQATAKESAERTGPAVVTGTSLEDVPRVVRTIPEDGAINVPTSLKELVIIFDEPMKQSWNVGCYPSFFPDASTGKKCSRDGFGWRDNKTFVIYLRSGLKPNQDYSFTINPRVGRENFDVNISFRGVDQSEPVPQKRFFFRTAR
ncbi:MAG: protein kinase [Deltaproteobacteria bacterium]|nr:protein kinase [Deltaproteobacteria bacterium]